MKKLNNIKTDLKVKNERFSRTAEEMAIHRAIESAKPENERVCYDKYAVNFLSPGPLQMVKMIASGNNRAKTMLEEMNRMFPGTQNSIIARVRYFDDFVKSSVVKGINQLVILGAGYDTRAYRIEGLENVNVFEIDHPESQKVKIETIKDIFGFLPNNVEYVPVNIGTDDLDQKLKEHGYEGSQKTLFTMEGLIYYFSPDIVDKLLSFIKENSGKGSQIIFDYFPKSLTDGTCELEVGKRMYNRVKEYGEPFKFGIDEENVEAFLTERGFSKVQNVTSEDYKKAYYHGINANREVCSLYSFVHAMNE